MVLTQFGDPTNFTVHSDDAPNVYITGNPSQTDPVTRNLEREMSHLNWLNPYTGSVQNNIIVALADKTEMKTLHMVTADPARTPTFTPFADPDWFFFATGARRVQRRPPVRRSPRGRARASPGTTATSRTRSPRPGPGTSGRGSGTSATTSDVWTDHTDHRPTMLTLLGLKDDYQTDGRAVTQIANENALPVSLRVAPSEPREAVGDVQAADGLVRLLRDGHAGRVVACPGEQLAR